MFAYAMRLTCFNNITKIDIRFFNDTFDFYFQYVIHFDRYLDFRTNTNNTDWNTCWLLQTLYWMWRIISHNRLCFVIELSISKVFPPFCRFNGAHFLLKICQRRNSEVWLFVLFYKKHHYLLNSTHLIFAEILSNDFIIACNNVQQTSTQKSEPTDRENQ